MADDGPDRTEYGSPVDEPTEQDELTPEEARARRDELIAELHTSHEETTSGEVEVRGGPRERREVIVGLRLYKTVTVFSTLLAILFVVLGFAFLDAATLSGSLVWRLIHAVPVTVALPVSDGTLSGVLALVGVACIGVGAGVYVLGARFRTAGMGKGKDERDGSSDDG